MRENENLIVISESKDAARAQREAQLEAEVDRLLRDRESSTNGSSDAAASQRGCRAWCGRWHTARKIHELVASVRLRRGSGPEG